MYLPSVWVIIYFYVFLHQCLALENWQKIPAVTGQTGYSFYAVAWSSDSSVVAVGTNNLNGIILYSADGITWSTGYSGTSQMYDVATVTISSVVWYLACSEDGYIYSSTNYGASWTQAKFLTASSSVYAITIGSNGQAYCVLGTFSVYTSSYSTSFATWTSVSPSISTSGTEIAVDVSTYDGVNVIAVGTDGNVYYTSTSGSSWSAGTSNAGSSDIIYCVQHGSSTTAMAGGTSGYLAITTDGGATWTSVTPFSSSVTIAYHSISMMSATEAYVAGSNGIIYYTTNAGSSWLVEYTATGSTLYSLSVYSTLRGVAGSAAVAGVFGVYAIVPGKQI